MFVLLAGLGPEKDFVRLRDVRNNEKRVFVFLAGLGPKEMIFRLRVRWAGRAARPPQQIILSLCAQDDASPPSCLLQAPLPSCAQKIVNSVHCSTILDLQQGDVHLLKQSILFLLRGPQLDLYADWQLCTARQSLPLLSDIICAFEWRT